jgi:hypothetical protein
MLRPNRTLIDPCAQNTDLLSGERVAFATGRHLHVFFEAGDETYERTVGTLARHDGWLTIGTTREGDSFHVETEVAFLFFRAVAFEAPLRENRLDVALEIDSAVDRQLQLRSICRPSTDGRKERYGQNRS